ncbi:maltodextrin glucosidase [Pseudaeromonas sp. ZJS20]|uniref:maltodextrin glucosidase n=1 Tax=Pseudaeromonas aegiceratis TaxID=3153928 RepID=UPI00390C6166
MSTPYFFHPQVAPWFKLGPAGASLTLFCHKDTQVDEIWLRHEPDNEEALLPMRLTGQHGQLAIWRGELPLPREQESSLYLFKIVSGDRQWWLHGAGVTPRMPTRAVHFRLHHRCRPPLWVQDQVFYQIFPDRFCNGDPSISVTDDEYQYGDGQHPVIAKAWGAPVSAHGQTGATEFYGGDLAGLQSRLYYLQSLGITALYLNPVFTSPSNHKYDTVDYYQVDPHLGSNGQLAELIDSLHQRGMRIVLDAVVDHTSDQHPWFDRYGQQGAYADPESPHRSCYTFDAGGSYVAWKGCMTLPKLDFASTAVQDRVYRADDAILRHWLRPPYQIDGWRFDVIHMLGERGTAANNAHHVREIRKVVKQENPEAYLLGEHFFEATQWLQGEQEDGAMNYYGFAHPLRAFLAGQDIAYQPVRINAAELDLWLRQARAGLPHANQLAQFNLLDSHDTARFLTLLDGDQALMRAAVTLLFTYAGVPCVYYGDEIGLEGGRDPDCRRCFPWESTEWNHLLHDHYRRMIRLRKTHPALRRGDIHTLYAGEHSFVFARTLESDVVITALNRHPEKARTMILPIWQTGSLATRFTDPENRDKFEVVKGEIQLTIPPKTARVLLAS